MKCCRNCRVEKSETDYHRDPRSRDGLVGTCRKCIKVRRGPRNGESIGRHLAKRYSITPAQYETILAGQGGRCANPGCRADSPQRRGRFQVDHDHACCPGDTSCGKCIRGLLCGPCNRLLGQARDSVAILSGAITYLSTHGRAV